jgi:hypothetical protein
MKHITAFYWQFGRMTVEHRCLVLRMARTQPAVGNSCMWMFGRPIITPGISLRWSTNVNSPYVDERRNLALSYTTDFVVSRAQIGRELIYLRTEQSRPRQTTWKRIASMLRNLQLI